MYCCLSHRKIISFQIMSNEDTLYIKVVALNEIYNFFIVFEFLHLRWLTCLKNIIKF
jgi:hypothetical protein